MAFPAVSPALLLGLVAAAVGLVSVAVGHLISALALIPMRYLEWVGDRLAEGPGGPRHVRRRPARAHRRSGVGGRARMGVASAMATAAAGDRARRRDLPADRLVVRAGRRSAVGARRAVLRRGAGRRRARDVAGRGGRAGRRRAGRGAGLDGARRARRQAPGRHGRDASPRRPHHRSARTSSAVCRSDWCWSRGVPGRRRSRPTSTRRSPTSMCRSAIRAPATPSPSATSAWTCCRPIDAGRTRTRTPTTTRW